MDFSVLTPHIIPRQWGHWFRILVTFHGPLTSCGFHSPFVPPSIHIQAWRPMFVGAGTWGRNVGPWRWLWQPASVFEDPQKHMWKTCPQGSAGGEQKGRKEVSVCACPFLFLIDQNQSQANPLSPPCGSNCFMWLGRPLPGKQDPAQ